MLQHLKGYQKSITLIKTDRLNNMLVSVTENANYQSIRLVYHTDTVWSLK